MTTNGSKPSTIPIVDFGEFNDSSPAATRQQIARDLVRACREVGFVYIVNHGVPADELAKAFAVSQHFYALPLSEKMKAPHPPGWEVHRGYSWPGLEKVSNATAGAGDDTEATSKLVEQMRSVQDFKESYEIGSEHDPDMPNVWPPDDVYPEWKPFMTSFYWTCFGAAKKVLRALALGIGLSDEEELVRQHSGHYNQLRLLHYPPIPARVLEDGRMERMPAHSDWSTITLLFQDDVGGLQVESPTEPGAFIDVDPVDGGMLVNIGDLMMRWSNDYLKSTPHRVTLPPLQDRYKGQERVTRARYSIPYFLTTDPEEEIACLSVGEGEKPEYEPITRREYYAMRAKMQY
ncbi:uncharacterized protein HMPREF1541_08540 [Cyphellophora europaea CBS 101466]|uniref:Fe2OG dioxygenase domain-containing protein n=1 Tax=Cyphellophora europaea (strain CBS 101466) TaxID=1220924 RepID=W2RKL8_CYPE1|nr:uncharacterized protein HMPREF1541_08540 [Cyphellophora europaea CBS 101466]ETN36263.1 hypothetical protein HMPREF1541_08540 [Cyphellophora europaea CBS 101466]